MATRTSIRAQSPRWRWVAAMAAALGLLLPPVGAAGSPRVRLALSTGQAVAGMGVAWGVAERREQVAVGLGLAGVAIGAAVGLGAGATLTDAEAGLLGSGMLLGSTNAILLSATRGLGDFGAAAPAMTLLGVIGARQLLRHAEVTPGRVWIADLGAIAGLGIATAGAASQGAQPGWLALGTTGGWLAGWALWKLGRPEPPLIWRAVGSGVFFGALSGALAGAQVGGPGMQGRAVVGGGIGGALLGAGLTWVFMRYAR